jgi:adenylate cyclase
MIITRIRLFFDHWSAALAKRFRNNFYLYLAALFSVLLLLDASVFHIGENMRQKAFDLVVRNRIITPKPDPNIVIVDIDEASLAALAGEYGRWPWPRQVFGEFLEQIELQKPKAIVFDILFSDADVYNPDSDAYFNNTIAATGNTFFPFLRLPEAHDGLSKVKPGMIPGIREIAPGQGNQESTIAVVLPHFEAAIASGRLGMHNIYPDPDGIVREYRLWREDYGWKLPSLPLTLGSQLGYAMPASQNVLLNWRGGPFTYRYVSFSDVYKDMGSKAKQRPQNEFTGKIVIIGSTAPSLFDLKATTMAKAHPGVEILATVIDNVEHADYLKFWRGALPYVLISLLLIWLTATMFYRNIDRDRFNRIFSSSQVGLLVFSYVSINLTNIFIDLTGPVTWAVVYFSVAKIYALATDRALQRQLAINTQVGKAGLRAMLMPVLVESDEPLGDALLKKLTREIEAIGSLPKSVEALKGTQSGIWGLFGDMLVVGWTCAPDDTAQIEDIRREAFEIADRLAQLLGKIGLPKSTATRHTLHEGLITDGKALAPQWRALFAEAVLGLEHQKEQT